MVTLSRQPNSLTRETGIPGLSCLSLRPGLAGEHARQATSLREESISLVVAMPAKSGTGHEDQNYKRDRSGERWGARM